MKDLVFYAENNGKPEVVGRLLPDGSWIGEEKLYEDIVYVAGKNSLDITTFEGRQMLFKMYSGAYLWAVMEMEDAPKK